MMPRYGVKALAQMYKIFLDREDVPSSVTPDFLRAQLARIGLTDETLPAFGTAKDQFLMVRSLRPDDLLVCCMNPVLRLYAAV